VKVTHTSQHARKRGRRTSHRPITLTFSETRVNSVIFYHAHLISLASLFCSILQWRFTSLLFCSVVLHKIFIYYILKVSLFYFTSPHLFSIISLYSSTLNLICFSSLIFCSVSLEFYPVCSNSILFYGILPFSSHFYVFSCISPHFYFSEH